MKVPAKASILFQRTGPFFTKRVKASMLLQRTGPNTFVSPNDFIHYPLTPDFVVFAKIGHPKNYIKRQSVYILPKKWTTEKPQKNGVKKTPKFLQNATERLYSSKEVDQTIFLGHFFTQDRRPIGRHLPHLRLRFVGINRYAIVMFAAYAALKICRATPH